jgi:hypothetical protein
MELQKENMKAKKKKRDFKGISLGRILSPPPLPPPFFFFKTRHSLTNRGANTKQEGWILFAINGG